MKKTTKTSIFRFAYIGVTVLVIILIGIFNSNFEDLGSAIRNINLFWLLLAFASMVAYWLTDAWLLQYITDAISADQNRLSFKSSLKIGIIGLYYSALTPTSVGGQPMQVMYMSREKIPVGRSSCIVVIKFLAYSLTVITYYFLAHALLGADYLKNSPAIYWLSIVGVFLNAIALALFVLSILKEKLILAMGHGLIGFLHKIKILKDPEKPTENFNKTIAEYTGTAKYLQGRMHKMAVAYVISFLNIGFMFMITYFVYRAFGLADYSYVSIMAVQALLYVAVSYFPLPGAAGASEGGFFAIFSAFFPQNILFMAMLMWRIMTYYIILAVGSLVVVFDEFFAIRRNRRKEIT